MSESSTQWPVARATSAPGDGGTPSVRVSALALQRFSEGRIARRTGERAVLRSLEVQLKAAQLGQDAEQERRIAAQVARRLAADGRRISEAIKLARRALLMGEDAELREELSGWFAGVGQYSLAAGTLRPLLDRVHDGAARAAIWLRIAVLSARDADGPRAAAALKAAADADRSDPLPAELLGATHRWAATAVSEEVAARAFIEASLRHEARGDLRAASDSLVMALDVAPGSLQAAEKVATQMARRGAFQASDEVWRRAAANSSDSPAIHARRVREALGAGDVATALGAALDQGSDCGLDIDGIAIAVELINDGAGSVPVPNFDGLLTPAGLTELLGARLELAAERHRGDERASLLLALAKLCAGPLGDPRRAGRALQEAVLANPSGPEVFKALGRFADASGDPLLLSETLMRCVRIGDREAQVVAAGRLLDLAQSGVVGADFGLWAIDELERIGSPVVEDSRQWASRVEMPVPVEPPSQGWAELPLAQLRSAIDRMEVDARSDESRLDALLEMRRRDPRAVCFRRSIERLLLQRGDKPALEAWWLDELGAPSGDRAAARLGLARLYRGRGAPIRAMELLLRDVESLGPAECAMAAALASLFGKNTERARGLEALAKNARPAVAAVLYAVASSLVAGDAEQDRARRLAEHACRADGAALRPVVAFAEATPEQGDRVSLLVLERVCEASVPRVEWCRALARQHSTPDKAFVWLRRWASLALLDGDASAELVERLVELGEPEPLLKALDWLLAQPMPLGLIVPGVVRAVRQLGQTRPESALGLARRLIGVFGVGDTDIEAALVDLSERLNEPLIRIAVIERGFVRDGAESASLLLEVARLRAQRGQVDLAYEACARALRANADPFALEPLLATLPAPESSDGELLALEVNLARKKVSSARSAGVELSVSYRELGAALWDLAGDRVGAVQAWEAASQVAPAEGDSELVSDLIAFCGYEQARAVLGEVAGRRSDAEGASLLGTAAKLALADGFRPEALDFAEQALALAPGYAGLLDTVEAAAGKGEVERLSRSYVRVFDALLGRFGERALSYRAARELNRRAEPEAALDWSMKAFEAVPGQGVGFAHMLRLASETGRETLVAKAMQRVASRAIAPEEQARWLARAASLLGQTSEGANLRTDAQVRAVSVAPSSDTFVGLSAALSSLLAHDPQQRELRQSEFQQLADRVLTRAAGTQRAEVGLAVAAIAVDTFTDGAIACRALMRALEQDTSWDIAEPSERWQPALLAVPQAAAGLVDAVVEACGRQPVGVRLLELMVAVAEVVKPEAVAGLVISRAEAHPAESEWTRRAEALRQTHPELSSLPRRDPEAAEEGIELLTQAEALLPTAEDAAIALLQRVFAEPALTAEARGRAFGHLAIVFEARSDFGALETLHTQCLDNADMPPQARSLAARALAELLSRRGSHAAALDVLDLLDSFGTATRRDIARAAEVARAGGVIGRELVLLQRLIESGDDDDAVELGRRLVTLHLQQGQQAQAVGAAGRLLELGVRDPELHDLLLEHAAKHDDWQQYARLVRERLASGPKPSESQVMRLADMLAHRLGDPEGAVTALKAAVEQGPVTEALLERYALCLQATGELEAAAQAYEQAARLSREPRGAARLAELSVRGYLECGLLQSAAHVLESKSIFPATESLLELRLQVATKQGDGAAQADALEELAFVSLAGAARRARWLLQAAECSLACGLTDKARARAQRAARIAPTDAEVLVGAKLVEYRVRGAGTSDEALSSVSELRAFGHLEDASLDELRVFLLAEALEQRIGPGAGLNELVDAKERIGLKPLIALGLLERAPSFSGPELEEALASISAGDVRGLRTDAQIAEVVRRSRDRAVGKPAAGSPAAPQGAAVTLPRPRSISPPSRAPRGTARPATTSPVTRIGLAFAPAKPVELERPALDLEVSPPISAYRGDAPTSLDDAIRRSLMAPDRVAAATEKTPTTAAEALAVVRRATGDDQEARHERIGLSRSFLERWPGDIPLLEVLWTALDADDDELASRALKQVLEVASGAELQATAPPLSDVQSDSTAVANVLLSGGSEPALQIAHLLWQQVPHLFRSPTFPAGVVRVNADANTPLGRAYSGIARSFGVARTSLFQGERTGPERHRLLLTEPLALVLEGAFPDAQDPSFQYRLGQWLIAARPELVLAVSLSPERLALILDSVLAAFGPPGRLSGDVAHVAQVAESLWEGLTPGAQRRLQELSAEPEAVALSVLRAAGDRIGARAGLFACGRLDCAIAEICRTHGLPEVARDQPGWLGRLCAEAPAVADVVRFASSAVYAQARFRAGGETDRGR